MSQPKEETDSHSRLELALTIKVQGKQEFELSIAGNYNNSVIPIPKKNAGGDYEYDALTNLDNYEVQKTIHRAMMLMEKVHDSKDKPKKQHQSKIEIKPRP